MTDVDDLAATIRAALERAIVIGREHDGCLHSRACDAFVALDALVAEARRAQAQLNSVLSTFENMERQHVTWTDQEGNEYHPDWCRECRVSATTKNLFAAAAGWKACRQERDEWKRRAEELQAALDYYVELYDSTAEAKEAADGNV